MKIHLPLGLRKVLLACLAAMTVSLPATLGTASGWAAVAYIASTRVYANFAGPQDVTYTEKTWATEGDAVSKMTITEDTEVKLDSTHPAWSGNGEARHEMEYVLGADVGAGTVNLKLTSEDAKDTQYFFKNLGDFKSLWLEGLGRWYIRDTTESFSNKIEDIYVHGSQLYIDASANEITDWKANIHIGTSQAKDNEGAFVAKKNVSTTGALDVVEDAKITFGGSDAAANMSFGSISGGGVLEINASSSGTLTLTQGGTVAGIHSSGASANVTFGGSLTLTGSGGSNIAGTLTVNGNGTLTLSGELLVGQISGTIGQLTLNEGAELGAQHGGLNIGTLVLSGDNVSLAIDVSESATITLTTLTANNHHLTIHLSGVTDEILSAEGYALFGDNGWNTAWNDSISLVSDSGRALKVNEQGKVVWAFALQELTWSGSDGSNTLAWTDGGTGWTGGDGTFHNGDSVTLTGSGNTAMQVTVTGNVTTGNLTISGDNTGGFTLAGSADGDSLHIGGDLSVSADAAFNLDVTVDGTITLNNAMLTVHQNFHHADGESLTVDGTGTFRIDLSGVSDNTITFNAAGYTFAEGITVECDSKANEGWEDFQNLTVRGTLKLTGHEVVLQGTNVIANLDATGMTSNDDHITFDGLNTSTTFTNKVTMEAAGLDVRGGKVILEQGASLYYFSMNGGTLTVATGGLTTTGNMSLVSGNSTSGGQITVTDGGVQVGGNYNQDTGSLTVTAGGMDVMGSLTLKNSNLTVEAGNVSVGGDLVITKEGDDAHSTFTVSQGDLEVTGALQVKSSGAVLNVTNGTLKLHKGLVTSSWTPQVNAHAVEFLNAEGEADYDGNLKATDVTMDGSGTQVLHSGQTGYFEISGDVTVKNGTLKVYTGAAGAASHIDGALRVEGGTFLWEATKGATMTVGSVNQTGGTLTVSGNMNVTGDVSIAQGATSFSVTGKTLSIGGHLSAESGSITLGAGGELVLQSGTATDNTLGTLTLSDNATLGFSLVDGSFTALTLGTLTLDGHTLTIDLGTELAAFLARNNGSATLDLFSGDAASSLYQAWSDGNIVLAEDYGYTCEVNAQGQFVFSGEPTTVTWSEESHSDNLTLVWENGNGEGRWDGQDFAAWNKVVLTGNSDSEKAITLKGTIQANSVTISGGTGKFVFGSDASGGSLEAAVITVGANTDFNAKVSVADSLTVQDGVMVNVGDAGSLHMDDGASITVGNGSNLVIAAGKLSHEGEVLQFTYSGGDAGSGAVEIKLGNQQRIIGLSAAKGVTLKLTNAEGYSFFQDITSEGDVVAAGNQVILDGTNTLVNLSDGGVELTSRFVLNDGHTSTTLSGNLDLSASALDVREGELVVQNGKITTGKGLLSNGSKALGYVKGKDLETTVTENTQTYGGALTLSGNLTKKGAGTQELQGGSNNDLSVTGTVTVEAGALNWGKANLESSMGSLTVTSGTFKLLGGTLTVNGAISAGGGTVDLGSAAGTLKVTAESTVGTLNLSGANAMLDLSGKLTVNALSGGNLTLAGLTMGAGGHLVLGTGIDSAINLGTITLTGAAELTLSGNSYSGLRFSGTWAAESAGKELTIHLNDEFLKSIESTGYDLFAGEGWAGHVTFATDAGSAYEGRVGLDGSGTKVIITTLLVWDVNGTDNTWSVGCTNWVSGGTWSDGSNATFSDETGETVTISGAVAPHDVNVTQGTWTFDGDGALSVGGKVTVGTEGGAAAHVTFGSTGGITLTGGLKLQGNGTTVSVGTTNDKSGGLLQFGDIELDEGTELVLTGAQYATSNNEATNGWRTATAFSNRPTTAHGDGSIVLEGLGEHEQGSGGTGILWAFTGNTDEAGHEIGNLRLRTHESTGTLLKATGEMGSTETHGFGNFTNIWVEEGNSLRDQAGALAKKKHSGNLLHLAGSGIGDQDSNYASKKDTYDGALVLATSTENVWNIQAEADATISVKESITLSGTLASQGNTLTIKTVDGKTTTLKGAYTAGDKGGTKGTLELSGGAVVLGDGFSMAGGEGTLKVSGSSVSSAQALTLGNVALNGGTLALSNGGTVSSLSGSGTLQVKGGMLTLTTVDSPTLTNLALGQGSTAGNLVVSGGSLTISGGWTWVEGSKLTLSVSGQQITLSGISELNGGNSDTKLTIDLTEAFLGGDKAGSGSVQLFATQDFNSQWKDYFKFTIGGEAASAGNYEGLALADNGMLTWGQGEPLPPATELTWDKGDENNTWDAVGQNANWTGDAKWNNGGTYTAIFADADGEAVTLSGELKAAGVKINQGTGWQFTADTADSSLAISGNLTVADGAKLTVGADTKITVGGDVNLNTSGELALASDLVIGGTITAGAGKVTRSGDTGTVYVLLTGTGSMSWEGFEDRFGTNAAALGVGVGYGVSVGGSGVELSGDFTLGKNFKVSGSGTATFSGNVTMGDSIGITIDEGATLDVTGSLVKNATSGQISVNGDGILRISFGGNNNRDKFRGLTAGAGITVNANITAGWGFLQDVSVLGELQVGADKEIIFLGTNTIGKLSGVRKLNLYVGNTKTTISQTEKLTVNNLSMQEGTLVLNGELEVNGTICNDTKSTANGGHIEGTSLTVNLGTDGQIDETATQGATAAWLGGLKLSGDFTKTGDGLLVIGGGSGNAYDAETTPGHRVLDIAGTVNISGGRVVFGQGAANDMNVGNGINLNGSGSVFEWRGKKLTVSGGTVSSTGGASLVIKHLALGAGESRLNFAAGVNVSGLTLTLTGFELDAFKGDGYQLFDSSCWQAAGWKEQIKLDYGELDMEGGSIDFNDTGALVWSAATQPSGGDLTWNVEGTNDVWGAGGGNNNWNTDQAWVDGSNAIFSHETGETVTISGTVAPRNVKVEKGTWTFTGSSADSASLQASGSITVAAGASASFSSLNTFTVHGGNIAGTLELDSTVSGEKTLGALSVAEGGSVTLADGTASNWLGTTISGDGSVVWGASATVDANNNLFAALFAAGQTDVQRDDAHAGIGKFVIAEGTTLTLSMGHNAASMMAMSLIKELVVENGASLVVGATQQFDYQGIYDQHGKVVLAGGGIAGTEDSAALVVNAQEYMKWDLELADDASVRLNSNTTLHFGGGVNYCGTFDGKGHKLTVKGSGTLKIDEAFQMVNTDGGTIEMQTGTTLLVATAGTLDMSGYTVALNSGSLNASQSANLHAISGSGAVSVGGGKALTVASADGTTFSGLTLGANASLEVTAGSFSIGGTWTWGSGSILRLRTSGQVITLNSGLSIPGGAENQLTIDLTEAFLGSDKTNGSVQLFATQGFDAQWVDYFRFTVGGQTTSAGNYEGLALTDGGMLTWGQSEPLPPATELTWDKVDDNNVWDAAGANTNWTGEQAWNNGGTYTAIFADATGEAVTLSGELKAAGVKINQGTEWQFTADTAGGSLAISGNLTVADGAKLTVGANTSVTVSGAIDLGTSGELTLASDLVFGGTLTAGAGKVTRSGNAGVFYMLWNGGETGTIEGTSFLDKFGTGANKLAQGVGYGVSAGESGVTLSGDFTIGKNFKVSGSGTTTFSGNVSMGNSIGITIDEGATLDVTGSLVKNATSGKISVNGDGNLRISFGGDENRDKFQGLTTGAGITVQTNITESWGFLQDVSVLGELQVGADKEIIFLGTNTIGKLSDVKKLNLYVGNTKTTISQTDKLTVGCLSMQEGTLILNGELEVNGAICNDTKSTANGGHIEGTSLTVNLGTDGQIDEEQESGSTAAWLGGLKLSGDFTKTGDGLLVIGGGSGNAYNAETDPGHRVLDIAGTVNISGGRVVFGQDASNNMTVGNGIALSGGSVFEWRGKTLTVSGGEVNCEGGASLSLGYLELAEGESRLNFAAGVELAELNLTLTGFDLDVFKADGGYQLFDANGWQDEWRSRITLDFGELDMGEDGEVNLNETGALVWAKRDDGLYWGGGDDEKELTWGIEGDEGKFDTSEDGSTGKTDWEEGKEVHFVEGTVDKKVKLAKKITTGNFYVTDPDTEDKAKFEFTSDKDGESRELEVKGTMTVTKSKVNFGHDVELSVEGTLTLDDSTLSTEGSAEFKGKITGDGTLSAGETGQVTVAGDVSGFDGTLDTGTGGRILLSSTGETRFKGKVTGEGTLGTEKDVTLAGDLSEFGGTLNTGTSGRITLSGDAVSGGVGVTAVGSGTLAVESAEGGTRFTGTIGTSDTDAVTLTNSGSGMLYVAEGTKSVTGAKLDGGEGGITLGESGNSAAWSGTAVVGGEITLANVILTSGALTEKSEGAKVYVDTAPAASAVRAVSVVEATGGVVDVGGMDAANLDGIKVNAHGLLTNVSGTYKVSPDRQLTLHFTEDNLGEEGAGLIAGNDGFTVELQGGDAAQQGLHLEFDEVEIIEELRKSGDAGTLYLRALKGGTWNAKAAGVTVDWEKEGGLMDILVSAYEFTEDGLKITGSTRDIYIVMDGEHSDSATSNSPADLAEKLATVVTKGKTLTLNWSGVGTVRNLLGEENSHLVINASDGQGLTVTLENAYHKTIHDDRYPGDVTEAQGMDTEFGGTITGGKGVNIVKSGLGTLTVGGDYSVVGDTRIAGGALRLMGAENTLGSLTFATGEGEKREIQLEGGKTSVGGITTGEGVSGATLKLTGGAELTLTGTSSMADAAITSEDNSGKLKLGKGASLTFTEGKGITGTAVEMKEAELDMGATQSVLTSLNGSGTLKSASEGTVTVGGGAFTGTLTGTGGTLVLKDKATFTLENATGTGMNVKLGAGASLLVDVSGKTGASGETLVLGNIELGDGSMKVDYGKNGIGPNFVQGNIVSVGSGSLEFHSDGPIANGKVETGFTLGTGDWQDFLDGIKYTGVGNFVKDHVAERGENDKLVLNMTDAVENKFEREIPGAGKNAHAGAQMLWESLRELTLGDALFAVFANPTSDYARLVFALVQDIDNGQTTGLERTLTSVAGASISTLTPALAQDIHRQLTTIRNRTTGMSAEVPTDGYDEFPFWHAWIQAEGGYHKMDADGTEPGFTLHNWGGTVGVDADISRATTMGLAVTAMYGDLKPDAADSATGDLDTVYLSAFARTMRGAWSHTFVLSGGIAEAKLDRTVSYNGGSYRTRGDTDGYVVGALYEVGYTRLANKEGTVALQPIANVELRHTSLRGYTEKGSDAGVDVDDMDMTVLTLGAGARVQAAVGENAFNRSSVLEARLLAKADIGDRSGTATNAIIGHSKRAEVESAEVGAVGIETGIGISIPLGSQSGSIFADASLEWRDNWVSTNATLGYRINF